MNHFVSNPVRFQPAAAHCAAWVLVAALCLPGCTIVRHDSTSHDGRASGLQVSAENRDFVWERAVTVLNEFHFTVARESKLEGLIESDYRAGANILEPWHADSPDAAARLESTLQSIRRRAIVSIQSSGPAMLNVSVRVDKEIEDVPALTATYEGGATFSDSQPLQRDLNQVLGQSGPSRWLPRGRDAKLEQQIMAAIRAGFGAR